MDRNGTFGLVAAMETLRQWSPMVATADVSSVLLQWTLRSAAMHTMGACKETGPTSLAGDGGLQEACKETGPTTPFPPESPDLSEPAVANV
jgi:hypothetical protein